MPGMPGNAAAAAANSPATNPAAATQALQTAQNATAQGSALQSVGSGASSFNSMNQFQEEQPKLYNMMMQSIAQNFCSQSSQQNAQIIQNIKDGEDNNP